MSVRLICGDATDVLATMADESVHCVVCSPPYFNLRNYSQPDQIGLEQTPKQYLENLWSVFDEVWRVLHPTGTVWCNLGDSYAGSGKGPTGHNGIGNQVKRQGFTGNPDRFRTSTLQVGQSTNLMQPGRQAYGGGIPGKNLLMIPYRFAIGMQDRGWYVRSHIAWCLSGGTPIYVRSQKGDMRTTVKDMARLNPETLQVWNGQRWTRVVQMWESEDIGDPIEIELRSGEKIGCTPNHQWPTQRGLIYAKDLTVGDRLQRVTLPEPCIPSKPSALDDEDIGWLVGLYLAEGCPSTNSISIASHVKETERFERVKRIAQSFDGSATMRNTVGNAATISIYGRIIRAILEEYVTGKNAHGKHLTNACWRRSNVFLRGVLDGYLHGDGHWDEPNQRWRLGFARNYEFASDLRTLCARLGVSLRLRPRFAQLNGRNFPTFRGEIRFTREDTLQHKSDDEIVGIGFSRGRKFWDIEVADDPHAFALASGVLTHNCKKSAMPESVRDRPTSAWESIWLFSKSPNYYYDQEAVRTSGKVYNGNAGTFARPKSVRGAALVPGQGYGTHRTDRDDRVPSGANMRNYWLLGPEPSTERHYAVYPTEIPRRCIAAGTSERGCCPVCLAPWVRQVRRTSDRVNLAEGLRQASRSNGAQKGGTDAVTLGVTASVRFETIGWRPSCQCDTLDDPIPCTVLDPFVGSGSTVVQAKKMRRDAIGIDVNPGYLDIARRRVDGVKKQAAVRRVRL